MKTPYEIKQELERIQRLVPHLISDQGERAEEILGFHVASLYACAPQSEHAMIREQVAQMQALCRQAERDIAPEPALLSLQPRWA